MSLDITLFYNVQDDNTKEVYSLNITHNLNTMADKAGLYYPLWQPHAIEATHAKDLIHVLLNGILWLEENKEEAEKYNAKNGWGDYHNLLLSAKEYLKNCKANPNAIIRTHR